MEISTILSAARAAALAAALAYGSYRVAGAVKSFRSRRQTNRELRAKGYTLPPVIDGWIPYFGVALEYGLDPRGFMIKYRKKYGEVFSVYMAGRYTTIISSLSFKTVFYKTASDKLLFFTPLKAVRLPEVIGAAFEEKHAAKLMDLLRRKLVPRYSAYVQEAMVHIESLFDRFMPGDSGVVANINEFTDHLIASISMQSLCSKFVEHDEFLTLARTLVHEGHVLLRAPGILGDPVLRRTAKIRARLLQLLQEEIDLRAAASAAGEPAPLDLLTFALETFPDISLVKDIIIGVLFGALANTNAAAALIAGHLASAPLLLKTLREELLAAPAGDHTATTTASGSHTPLLDSVILETTRYYAIVLSNRATAEDLDIELVPDEDGGAAPKRFFFPQGTTLGFSSHFHMRRPDLFEDPDAWVADRFVARPAADAAAAAVAPIKPYGGRDAAVVTAEKRELLGFGMGRHLCKGMGLALAELNVICRMLVTRYDLELVGDGMPEVDYVSLGLALPVTPISIRYRRLV
ncbi:cytochrome P450 [Zopfochytrium polystomum]|nr:cytochrome P450 [Zopfochytrium polystomum]